MDDVARQRLARIVGELEDLIPQFVATIAQFDAKMSIFEESKGAEEQRWSQEFWVSAAYRNAMIRLRLILENNFSYLETLNVLATTRYVFETLVWLRLLDREPDYGLVFCGRVISGQLQHFKDYKKKLEEEIGFFERLAQDESALHQDSLTKLTESVPIPTADHVSTATAAIMNEIDRRARRAFSLYADDAKRNGYGFQAHLVRKQAVPHVAAQIEELEAEQKALVAACPARVRTKLKDRWNWKAEAGRVDMQAQYEFIYSFTSRLLHATPSSIFTDQKNLEVSEMVVFLDYVYVSMLDVLELGARQIGSDN
ncbi:hypothetical protein [Mesorhizobium sp.]|uniref:hypothetical protein n=1 Tax=Mesorhizobium sp. TaxID=1871066 RepID=UPI000FE6703F|nr:hypothetical protein [Mesorhizobium sp.]RWJ32018.1 MAG: hypothetical protein EOR28_14705 [Mesorhizobium sp.]TIQ73776.1 MAG: hypothetical protein E5X40_05160 [Mesorhizobium sp.]